MFLIIKLNSNLQSLFTQEGVEGGSPPSGEGVSVSPLTPKQGRFRGLKPFHICSNPC